MRSPVAITGFRRRAVIPRATSRFAFATTPSMAGDSGVGMNLDVEELVDAYSVDPLDAHLTLLLPKICRLVAYSYRMRGSTSAYSIDAQARSSSEGVGRVYRRSVLITKYFCCYIGRRTN